MLICWCWPTRRELSTVEAQVDTSKVSLDQAMANHEAGTAPLLDELRAQVDYQSLEQQLIVAKNRSKKTSLRWRGLSACRWRKAQPYGPGALRGL